MIKYILLYFGVFLFFFSCKTTQKTVTKPSTNSKNITITANSSTAKILISEAKSYLGTPYKFAGTTKQGMDCSGLVFTSYQKININLPRKSAEQAQQGKKIELEDVVVGDLLFFNTSGKGISHVGLVESIKNGEVFFIHSSTSKGVMISSLNEKYWKERFVIAKRIL